MEEDNQLQASQGVAVNRGDCHIAMVPSMGLGDSLIYLVVATNLARAGYRVTVLSNHLAHFAQWLPHLEVLPFPEPEHTPAISQRYDLVLSDCGSIVTSIDADVRTLAEQFVFVGTLRVKAEYVHNHVDRLVRRVGMAKAALMHDLASCAGAIRVIDDASASMVEQARAFCQSRLGIADARADAGFLIPAELTARRYSRRVLLHPTSYNEKKNWPYQKYLQLARRFRQAGYEPQFVLSPKERSHWAPRFESEFPVPKFANARELAVYIYESGYVVGNDSGVGHLASAVGVPVLTIYRKRRDGFCWRPGWGVNQVVRPFLSVGMFRHGWKHFLSVRHAEKAFAKLVCKYESDSR